MTDYDNTFDLFVQKIIIIIIIKNKNICFNTKVFFFIIVYIQNI